MTNLKRFIDAQDRDYAIALREVKNGRKQSHWMWYVFPQILGLGHSDISQYYAIKDMLEAEAYIAHPVLGTRLVQICEELNKLPVNDPSMIFGYPDDFKLKSCLTLFASLHHPNPIFEILLQKFFYGELDSKTLELLKLTE